LTIQAADAAPSAVGVNRTVSVTVSPGCTTLPSDSVLTAANPLSAGGLDFVIVTGTPPALRSVNVRSAEDPTGTSPKLTASDDSSSRPGCEAVPLRPIGALPPSESKTI